MKVMYKWGMVELLWELRGEDVRLAGSGPEEDEEAYYKTTPLARWSRGAHTCYTIVIRTKILSKKECANAWTLDCSELTLDEFRVWHRNNDMEASYQGHYQNWISRNHEMHTLPEAKKLVAELSGLKGEWLPMCGASCSSYLGKYEGLERCPHSRKINGQIVPYDRAHYALSFGRSAIPGHLTPDKRKTEKRFLFCKPLHRIKPLFRASQTAEIMGYFGRKLEETQAKMEYLIEKLKSGYRLKIVHGGTHRFAYVVTAPFLGKYYRTYGAYCATERFNAGSPNPTYTKRWFFDTRPFVVVDKKPPLYVFERFPGDAQKFAENFLQLLNEAKKRRLFLHETGMWLPELSQDHHPMLNSLVSRYLGSLIPLL
ncbi:hypothetical protein BT69DRAFT_1379640 [Atractiella rhizophila]|nr:hypothetical protein BT69DRAFT_1379640 [Atractiella rhizophila]